MKKETHMLLTKGVRVTITDRNAKPIPEPERRARILRGLQRLTDEARQLGRDDAAAKAQTLVDEATRIVGQLCDIEAAINEPYLAVCEVIGHLDLLIEKDLAIGDDFNPAAGEEQPRLDEKEPVECPQCGHKFIWNQWEK